jgi:Kef-type K+ transport system membrane component KefB
MLVIELIIGLVIFDAIAVGGYYANAALFAAVSEGPLSVDVWWTLIHLVYFHAVVILGAWVGWRVRQRPV